MYRSTSCPLRSEACVADRDMQSPERTCRCDLSWWRECVTSLIAGHYRWSTLPRTEVLQRIASCERSMQAQDDALLKHAMAWFSSR